MPEDLKLTRYLVVSDGLNVAETGHCYRTLFSTRSGAVLVVREEMWQLLKCGSIEQLPVPTRQRFVDALVLVPEHEDELTAVVIENEKAIDANDVLYEVIQPTAWCQLDCHYCGQEHAHHMLSRSEQEQLLARLNARLSSGKYRQLKVGWFGSEPLAGLPVIRSLSPRLRRTAEAFSCNYSARIVTNGMALTPKIAAELIALSVQEAEVTIDGLEGDHDARRYTKGGKGTFKQIFANVCATARTTELGLAIRCNVDGRNAEGVRSLIELIAEKGLAGRVRFYVSPVYSWGNDAHEAALDKKSFAEMEMEWLALQIRLGFNVGILPPRRKIVCMAVQKEAEVLDAYGTTFNCTEAPYVPAYGKPNVYSIRFVRNAGDRNCVTGHDAPLLLRTFNQQLLHKEHTQCFDCAMLPVCGGQCPKAWHEGHSPCPSAKENMPQRLNVLFALGHNNG
ncbi:MAG: radical SAM protein [Vicinamibacterales bacterium]